MAAGFISKALSTLQATTARWIEFGDGSQAPAHGAIIIDPATGLPIDASTATLVKEQATSAPSASLSAPGTFFVADMDGYECLNLQVIGTFTGAAFAFETAEEQVSWVPQFGMSLNPTVSMWASQFGAVGPYRVPRAMRYTKVALTALTSGTVQIIGNKGRSPLYPAQRSGEGNEVSHPNALPSRFWKYAAASGGITTTTPVTLIAANASYQNHLLGFTARNTHASVDTELIIKEGGNVIWREELIHQGPPVSVNTNIRGAANTALSAECGTTGSKMYINAYGFITR